MAAGGTSLSVTVIPNVVVPCVVGMPERSPVPLRVNPGGRVDPLATVQEYGIVPPVAWSCWLYSAPPVAGGSVAGVEIARLPMLTVNDTDIATLPSASVV